MDAAPTVLPIPVLPQPAAPRLAVAYALWATFAVFGAHRFYAGQRTSAWLMLGLTLASALTAPLGIGLIGLVLVMVWVVGDVFLIAGMVRAAKLAAG